MPVLFLIIVLSYINLNFCRKQEDINKELQQKKKKEQMDLDMDLDLDLDLDRIWIGFG